EFFESLVGRWGKLTSLDPNTSLMERFDVAGILISTTFVGMIIERVKISVNNDDFIIVEETSPVMHGNFSSSSHLKHPSILALPEKDAFSSCDAD
ncbi:hypothetical protein Ancab_034197, partial [Ancistrocladus abbreviatus]